MSLSAPQLPIELYRQIVFDPTLLLSDLYSLSLTTHPLSFEAYSALYTRVSLRASQATKLALRTFLESDRVAQLVRELLLHPDVAFRVEFGMSTPLMINAIHRMRNLKALTLGYLWTADPFGDVRRTEVPAPDSNSAAADVGVFGGDTNQQQPGPPGLGRTAWTRGLKVPFIEKLTIETTTYRPIRQLFGELPDPLPHLVAMRPMHVRDLVGIRKVTCERVYGQVPAASPVAEGEVAEAGVLAALESLEIANLDSYPMRSDWAPNLTTVSIAVGGGRGEYFITSQSFKYLGNVKRIGPVVCYAVSEDFLESMSQLRRLEGLVLILPRIGYRDFGASDLERMRRAAPCLSWVALVPSDRSRPGVFTEYTKWKMRDADDSRGGHHRDELERWSKVNLRFEDWGFTLSSLLYST